jgi:NTP pyrophosphatase (non-canonical NTP hydrolase)
MTEHLYEPTAVESDTEDPQLMLTAAWQAHVYVLGLHVREAASLLHQSGRHDVAYSLGILLDSYPKQPATATDPVLPEWDAVGRLVDWLNQTNGHSEQETALRLLKVTEEAGEVAAAYIGMQGQNPRKGVTHNPVDVADELCDVIVSAMVALHSFCANPGRHFADAVNEVTSRVLPASQTEN